MPHSFPLFFENDEQYSAILLVLFKILRDSFSILYFHCCGQVVTLIKRNQTGKLSTDRQLNASISNLSELMSSIVNIPSSIETKPKKKKRKKEKKKNAHDLVQQTPAR